MKKGLFEGVHRILVEKVLQAWFLLQRGYNELIFGAKWSNDVVFSIMIFFYLSWLLLLWVFFFISWTNYYLDVLIITNERVIDIEQLSLFARDIAEVGLHNIEDIRVAVVGVIPTLFGFGNLFLQTAGASREFVIKNIPKPLEIKDLIVRAQHKKGLSNM